MRRVKLIFAECTVLRVAKSSTRSSWQTVMLYQYQAHEIKLATDSSTMGFPMKKNIGSTDALIRGLVALMLFFGGLLILWGFEYLEGIVFLIIATALLVTVILEYSPIYSLLRISTRDVSSDGNVQIFERRIPPEWTGPVPSNFRKRNALRR